jgi:hypothetical protein
MLGDELKRLGDEQERQTDYQEGLGYGLERLEDEQERLEMSRRGEIRAGGAGRRAGEAGR